MNDNHDEHGNGDSYRCDHRLARRLRRQHYLAAQVNEASSLPAPIDLAPPPHAPHGHAHIHKNPAVGELEKTIETLRDQVVRTQAEFDNYRKRQRRDEQQRLELANQALIEQMLPVLDNFGRALANPGDSVQTLLSGLVMVQNQFSDILRQQGLDKIEALGQPFDPNKHEAVSVDATDEVPDGQVTGVFQDGYTLKGRLVRPAMVKVARHA